MSDLEDQLRSLYAAHAQSAPAGEDLVAQVHERARRKDRYRIVGGLSGVAAAAAVTAIAVASIGLTSHPEPVGPAAGGSVQSTPTQSMFPSTTMSMPDPTDMMILDKSCPDLGVVISAPGHDLDLPRAKVHEITLPASGDYTMSVVSRSCAGRQITIVTDPAVMTFDRIVAPTPFGVDLYTLHVHAGAHASTTMAIELGCPKSAPNCLDPYGAIGTLTAIKVTFGGVAPSPTTSGATQP